MSVGTFHILQSHVHVPAFILIRENFESKELVFIPGEIEFGNIKYLTVCRLREVTCIACFNVLRYRGFLHLLPVMEVVREERAGRVRSMYFPAAYLRIPLLKVGIMGETVGYFDFSHSPQQVHVVADTLCLFRGGRCRISGQRHGTVPHSQGI